MKVSIMFDSGRLGRLAASGSVVLVLLIACLAAVPEPEAGPTFTRSQNTSSASPAAPSILYLPLLMKTGASWWQPPLHARLQLQFVDPLDQTIDADVYDVDLFDTSADAIASLHAKGRRAVCYINVGAWEDWRPDKDQFPTAVLGKEYQGWPGERWLDIRQVALLAPVMRARLNQCKTKGFDGVEPDNINGYQNDTGFPLTYQDQITYNLWLASAAHALGLSIGLKNDTEQAGDLLTSFDFVVTESCLAQGWCDQAVPFIQAGKPVFAVEYTDEVSTTHFLNDLCPQAQALDLNAVLKNRTLDAWRQACPSK